jgi:hypothetical protein
LPDEEKDTLKNKLKDKELEFEFCVPCTCQSQYYQVTIPAENIDKIEIHRRYNLQLDEIIQVSKDIKEINSSCQIDLSLTGDKFSEKVDTNACKNNITSDLFSNIEIANSTEFSNMNPLISKILSTHPNLKSFTYPNTLSSISQQSLKTHLDTMPNCIIKKSNTQINNRE